MRLDVKIDYGMFVRADRAALRDRDLKVGKKLQQQRFELVIGTVDFVNQQQRAVRFLQCFEHGASDQEFVTVDVHILIARLTDREHLARVVPLV